MFHIFLNIFDIFIYMLDMLIDISICLPICIYIYMGLTIVMVLGLAHRFAMLYRGPLLLLACRLAWLTIALLRILCWSPSSPCLRTARIMQLKTCLLPPRRCRPVALQIHSAVPSSGSTPVVVGSSFFITCDRQFDAFVPYIYIYISIIISIS